MEIIVNIQQAERMATWALRTCLLVHMSVEANALCFQGILATCLVKMRRREAAMVFVGQ